MDWKSTLSAIAPTLATALGGPLAGAATKFLASELLGDESASVESIESAIVNASPEQLASIKKLDNDFKIKMKELDVDIFNLEVQDRDSARDREVKMAESGANDWMMNVTGRYSRMSIYDHKDSNTPAVLVYMLTALIAIVVYFLFTDVVPESNENTLYMLLGSLTTAWLQSVSYWTGTTRSSSDKNKLIR